jgi:hypothetical protein
MAFVLVLGAFVSCKGSLAPEAAPSAPSILATSKPGSSEFGPAVIDVALRAEWKRAGVVPAPRVDDARFLRRVHVDLVGVIPRPEEVTRFVADPAPDKRAKVVEALLASPRYADRWTDYWDDVLMGRFVKAKVIDRAEFRRWLHLQFAENVPWNKLVYGLVTASGTNRGGGDGVADVTATADSVDSANGANADPETNGAVNWLLKYGRNPQDLAGNTSRVFLGVQIQCAQCHDHKTEKWTQNDFRSFAANFTRTRAVPLGNDEGKPKRRRIEVRDVDRPVRGGPKNPELRELAGVEPAALDGTDLSASPNPRQALAAWMTGDTNPWFARALVNRIWAHLLGRGFVEPIDDLRPSNPGVMPQLLQQIADDFVAHGHDLKHLLRTLCATEAYQLSSASLAAGAKPDALWARFALKPMAPDVLLDSIVTATALEPVLERVAGENLDQLKTRLKQQFVFLFDVDEDSAEDVYEGTIPQALMLQNGLLVSGGSSAIPGAALSRVLAMPGGDAAKIEALYLAALSRMPTPAEIERWKTFLDAPREMAAAGAGAGQDPRQRQRGKRGRAPGAEPLAGAQRRLGSSATTAKDQAYEDLFWALLNSSEFIFNH